MSNASVNLDSNVFIRCINRHGKITSQSRIHNKATVGLVNSLLRFLKGDFLTNYSTEEVASMLPEYVKFGTIGLKFSTVDGRRYFDRIDSSEFIQPSFNSYKLQEPRSISHREHLHFGRIRQTSYSDTNNSECLEFSLYLNPGTLVGYTLEGSGEFHPYEWSYYNPKTEEWEALFTEVGLESSSGNLLARVLFDNPVKRVSDSASNNEPYPLLSEINSDHNPIIQSQSSTVVLTWRVGIVSVGDNDEFVTVNDSLCKMLAGHLLRTYNIIDPSTGTQVSESDLATEIHNTYN